MAAFRFQSVIKHHWFALAVGAVHWLTTFFTERLILTVSPGENLFNYLLCKLLLLAALIGLWEFLWRSVFSPQRKENPERQYLLYGLAYLLVLLVWLFRRHSFVLVSDELNLFERAIKLDSFAYWFNYPSGFYWIICLMAVPHYMGPTFVKVFLQALTAGYCVGRQARLTGKKTACLLYLLFLLPFVMDQGISAHRLPTYGLLFLFLMAKVMYDRFEHKTLTNGKLVGLSAVIGLLAIWRSEGFYLIIAGAIVLASAYRLKPGKKLLKQLAVYALIIVIVALPQVDAYRTAEADVELRSKPLCGYLLCNMFRNGLTEDMLAEERAAIEGYLKFETIHAYNQTYGDQNYSGAFVMSGTEEADYATQKLFCDAVVRVVIKHPLIYLKSQWNAWRFTSAQYVLDFSGGLRGLVRGFENLSYRVSIPCMLVLLFGILALILRKWLAFWICCCGIANWCLVFLLMPAAYAKYFYVDYLIGYFFLLVTFCFLLQKVRKDRAKAAD